MLPGESVLSKGTGICKGLEESRFIHRIQSSLVCSDFEGDLLGRERMLERKPGLMPSSQAAFLLGGH